MTDPLEYARSQQPEPFLSPRLAARVRNQLGTAAVMLAAARTTLAAAHQPEHVAVTQALEMVKAANMRVSMRADAHARNLEHARNMRKAQRSE